MRRVMGACLVFLLGLFVTSGLWAEEKETLCEAVQPPLAKQEKCAMCGMDLSKYLHVRFAIATTEGKEMAYCGAQCGLMTNILMGADKVKSMWATGFITGRPVDAKKAWYVFKSSVPTDMSPGLLAFERKEYAEKFRKGFGGEVLDYENAIAALKNLKKGKEKMEQKGQM